MIPQKNNDDSSNDDLSPLERLRLDNIRRNELFLNSLGLTKKTELVSKSKKERATRKIVHDSDNKGGLLKRRRSTRISCTDKDTDIEEAKEKEDTDMEGEKGEEMIAVDYNLMPTSSDELDDSEFEVYTQLRSWRRARSNDLEIEPYKIFQNRTICGFIRAKRNGPSWATSECMQKNSEDLRQVWGIGPVKVQEGGFAHEMLEYFNSNSLNLVLTSALLQ